MCVPTCAGFAWDRVGSTLSKCQSKALHRFILIQGHVQILDTNLRAQMFEGRKMKD